MNQEQNHFSTNLLHLMRKARIGLKELETMTGIPKSTLQRWSAEGATPRLEKRLVILAKHFKVPVEKLLFQDCTTIKKKQLKRITKKLKTVYGKQLELSFSSGKNSLECNVEFKKEA